MSAKTFVICGLSFAAFVFLAIAYAIHRRVVRVRREWARLAYQKQLVRAQDTADDAEHQVWGIG